VEIATEISEAIDDNYSFEKHDFVYENNFGLVDFSEDSRGALVEC